jgi:hypothetical protein
MNEDSFKLMNDIGGTEYAWNDYEGSKSILSKPTAFRENYDSFDESVSVTSSTPDDSEFKFGYLS